MFASRSSLVGVTLLMAFGCNNDQNFQKIPDPSRNGELTLTGRLCDPVRGTWLEGATVYTHLFDKEGRLFGTATSVSDEEGLYILDRLAAEETYTVYVQLGAELIDQFEITMPEDSVTLPDPECGNQTLGAVAVITGDYDHFDELLPKVGIESWDLINGLTGENLRQFLSNEEGLLEYDAIFFPGGHLEEDVIYDLDGSETSGTILEVHDAIRAYVRAGGVVYASDWSYDVIEQIWPEKIDFLGDDAIPDAAQMGEEASILATVTDSELEGALGTDSVPITFDISEWPLMEGASADTTVYQTGNVTYRIGMETYNLSGVPILVGFEDGDGQVIFSSWRQYTNDEGAALDTVRFMVGLIDSE